MELIKEQDFFEFATEELKSALVNTVNTTIEKTGAKKGDIGEGATKYTFDGRDDILAIFYKYEMISDNEPKCNYEIYHGTEETDLVLDKLNDLKKRTEAKGETFAWG